MILADWSAASRPGPARPKTPPKDRLYLASPGQAPRYHPTRAGAELALTDAMAHSIRSGGRLFVGIDVGLGLPAGVTSRLTGQSEAPALWAFLAANLCDDPATGRHNLFAVAADINQALPGDGPFWGRLGADPARLPATRPHAPAYPALRHTEERLDARPKSMFQLAYAGAVGAQSLLAMAMLARWRRRFGKALAVWPFDDPRQAAIVVAELYLSLLPLPQSHGRRRAVHVTSIAVEGGQSLPMTDATKARDPVQVAVFAATLARLGQSGAWSDLLAPPPPDTPWREEGWVLGTGHEAWLRDTANHVMRCHATD